MEFFKLNSEWTKLIEWIHVFSIANKVLLLQLAFLLLKNTQRKFQSFCYLFKFVKKQIFITATTSHNNFNVILFRNVSKRCLLSGCKKCP